MRKHATIEAAEKLAAKGWEAADFIRTPASVGVVYKHPEAEGRVTVWSSDFEDDQIITYTNVNGVPDGFYDLVRGEFVAD